MQRLILEKQEDGGTKVRVRLERLGVGARLVVSVDEQITDRLLDGRDAASLFETLSFDVPFLTRDAFTGIGTGFQLTIEVAGARGEYRWCHLSPKGWEGVSDLANRLLDLARRTTGLYALA